MLCPASSTLAHVATAMLHGACSTHAAELVALVPTNLRTGLRDDARIGAGERHRRHPAVFETPILVEVEDTLGVFHSRCVNGKVSKIKTDPQQHRRDFDTEARHGIARQPSKLRLLAAAQEHVQLFE